MEPACRAPSRNRRGAFDDESPAAARQQSKPFVNLNAAVDKRRQKQSARDDYRRPLKVPIIENVDGRINVTTFISMAITFDPAKRAVTLTHRRLDFADAAEVF